MLRRPGEPADATRSHYRNRAPRKSGTSFRPTL